MLPVYEAQAGRKEGKGLQTQSLLLLFWSPVTGSRICDKVCSKCQKQHHLHLHDTPNLVTWQEVEEARWKNQVFSHWRLYIINLQVEAQSISWHPDCECNREARKWDVLLWLIREVIRRSSDVILWIGLALKAMIIRTRWTTMVSEDWSECTFFKENLTVPDIPIRATCDGTSHQRWAHLQDLNVPSVDFPINLIIGTDCSEMLWSLEERRSDQKQPLARKIFLGWIRFGPTAGEPHELSGGAAHCYPI